MKRVFWCVPKMSFCLLGPKVFSMFCSVPLERIVLRDEHDTSRSEDLLLINYAS